MKSQSDPNDQTHETDEKSSFVKKLLSLAIQAEAGGSGARASLARLRRTVGDGAPEFAGLREIGDSLPADLLANELDSYLIVAGLFALNPPSNSNRGRGSFGAALRSLHERLRVGSSSLERRVAALLDSDPNELSHRLRQLTMQLSSQGIVPDYQRLLRDLLSWNHPSRIVQRKWATDYWATERKSPSSKSSSNEAVS